MTAIGELELQEAPEPGPPRPGEALIEVAATGLGISQLHILAGTTHPRPLPRVLGHEVVGVVAAMAGTAQGRVQVGDLVVVNPLAGCGSCRQCEAGQASVCPNRSFLGMEGDGGWADFLLVPYAQVHKLPAGTPPAEAVMLASAVPTAVHAAARAEVRPGDRVVVIGLGSIGLLLCQVARARGAQTVIGVHSHPREVPVGDRFLDAAVDIGGCSADAAAVRIQAALGAPAGADVVFEAAGTQAALDVAVLAVRTGGVVLAMGLIRGQAGIRFDDYIEQFGVREITIRGTYAYGAEDFPTAIDLHATGRVEVSSLLAGEVTPEEVPPLIDRLRVEGTGGKRYVIRF